LSVNLNKIGQKGANSIQSKGILHPMKIQKLTFYPLDRTKKRDGEDSSPDQSDFSDQLLKQ
jgi:hypothetical protein